VSDLAHVVVESRGSVCLVRITGEIDISNAGEVSASIEDAVPNGVPTLVVDLTHTTYLDSAGVKLLFQLADRFRTRRRELRLIVPREAPIRAVLELTDLPHVAALEDRLDEGP
jgi:anti-sigma B factor antagonist